MTDWTPEFEGQRPPFEPGNTLATKHGARSERQIAPRAKAVLDEIVADPSLPDYLADASYRGALAGLARAEAVIGMLEEHIEGLPVGKITGGALPLLEQYRRWLTTAATHRRALGLDPTSRAGLAKDLSVARHSAATAVATESAQGAQVLAARKRAAEAAQIVVDGAESGDEA